MEDILMNEREVEIYSLLKEHEKGHKTLVDCSNELNLSYRQTLRRWQRFQQLGKKGLISRKRGMKSNRAFPTKLINHILAIVREHYGDFGPTLATEKLEERHGITVSRELVRQLMIKNHIYKPKRIKEVQVHQRRKRRERVGELLQMDGSDHAWFEERGPKCTLLVMIDDATSIVTARFEKSETTNGYFRLMHNYLESYGKPLFLYTDKYGVFRVNHKGKEGNKTQFTRAMQELGIGIIYANSPQAKGRVERVNETLQDRLVKELRLQDISNIDDANDFLITYLEDFNNRFSKEALNPINAHRSLKPICDLKKILCHKETRKMSKNLEIQYNNRIFQVKTPGRERRLANARIEVVETLDGEIFLKYKGNNLTYKEYGELEAQPLTLDHKEINNWNTRKRHIPPLSHPWKKNYGRSERIC